VSKVQQAYQRHAGVQLSPKRQRDLDGVINKIAYASSSISQDDKDRTREVLCLFEQERSEMKRM
jgi:hypothetical protein